MLTINSKAVHLWLAFIPDLLHQIKSFSRLLDTSEMQRAERFHFDEHRHRFIITRGILRSILSLYTDVNAADLVFTHGARGKPYLRDNKLNLQFNVSHSHDMAVYALTAQDEIGIDIERIKADFSDGVAKRFFSQQEHEEIVALPEHEQASAFYHVWAGKEAIIKALGEGLFASLSDFSIDLKKKNQLIKVQHQQQEFQYHLNYFSAHPDYQSAFAIAQSIEEINYQQWTANGPIKIDHLPEAS